MNKRIYEITDDSGFMALVDPASYESFVDGDWKFDQLIRHFKNAMKKRQLVMWGTGREDLWRTEVRFRRSNALGFREFSTVVRATSGGLLLTNYESLTMAAQFDDVSLPEKHHEDLLIPVTSGDYRCRIVQRLDPEVGDPKLRGKMADFIIELIAATLDDKKANNAPGIPWTDY
jgi:hypothetical protein